jgi:ABC-type Fe3+ transport system permease subunit
VRPAALGAFLLAFVLALSDFAVPDLLGFMLPGGGAPTYTFATEILLQWKQEGNVGRAVATGVPFLVLTLVPALVAVLLLRRSPAFAARAREEALPPIALRRRTRIAFTLLWVALLVVAVGIPFLGIVGWVGTGESVASGSGPAPVATATSGRLGDFQGALDRTEGSRGERDRWIHTALVAAVLSLLVAVPLVRAALRRAGPWRTAVLGLGLLALATPGLALSVGTRLLHDALPRTALSEGIVPSVLALTARFLPVALLMAWLTLRQVRRGGEEAARLLGAGAWTRFATIVLRPALPGFVAAALLVLVLALRELEVVMVLDTRILPLRLYDKIHFSRLADEANLLLYCVAIQLAPAALLGLGRLLARRARPVREGGPGLP